MGLAHEPIKLTYQDYRLLPEEKRVELIDGDFLMTPSPGSRHQEISGEISFHIRQWVKSKDLGKVFDAPMDVVLSEYDVVQPDILFIVKKRLGMIQEANIQGPPDLVIEIVSPGTRERDTEVKKHLYSKFGVREYWIVDPEAGTVTLLAYEKNRLEVKQTYPQNGVLESSVLSGFQLPLSEIFISASK